jgi:hypothetical protein
LLQSVFFDAIVIDFKIFKNPNELPTEWDALVHHDYFLQSTYLKAIDAASPGNISLYYVGFYKAEKLVGVTVIQRVQLYLNDIFRNQEDSRIRERFKNIISRVLRGNILVVGNLTHTGQHGMYFDENKFTYDEFLNVLFEALEFLKLEIRTKHNKKVRAFLMKDYFLNDALLNHNKLITSMGFSKLVVQPNMIMETQSHWTNFNDYISDLQKKYRDRYKAARRKSKQIIKKELNKIEVQNSSELLYKLYKNVSNNAEINTFILPKNHFSKFKNQLDTSFKVYGYYLDNKLIGFYSLILNNSVVETYFLGYDPNYQYKHQIYLNMLYDMAQFGIENNFKSIVYARTAMEIKSSVGAKPRAMVMYLKHTNWLMNALLKSIFSLMNPSQDWQERHPFK